MTVIERLFRRARGLRAEEGYTLIELLVVLGILGLVLAPLTSSFASAMNNQTSQTRREESYSNARLALQRMRLDIHCAGGVTSVDENAVGGFTLTMTENHQGQEGWCPGVIPAGEVSSGVQWCTVPYPGSPTRFVLYRYLGLDPNDCGSGTSSTFQVDYIAQPPSGWPTSTRTTTPPTDWIGNLWPDPTACPSGGLPTVAVDVNVALDPVAHPSERYELRDQIALRNANRTC
jgi:prepilin-type N-terminal cleavage/methylation domain-containing protein